MKNLLPIEIHERLVREVRSAWICLNEAGDTPIAQRSILSLDVAWQHILSVAHALDGLRDPDAIILRYHQSIARQTTKPADVLVSLALRADEIRERPKDIVENTSDSMMVHAAIPILWRIIRELRRELRARRPLASYTRRGIVTLKLALLLLVLWIGYHSLQLLRFSGIKVTYYATENLESIRGIASMPALFFDLDKGRPLPWIRRDHWSARWQGVLLVPKTDDYSFFAQCNGGMRMWLDDHLVIDNWAAHGWKRSGQHANQTLSKGPHTLRIEYRDTGGPAAMRVRWTGGPIPPNTIISAPHLRKR
ncbi:MAG: PA14 domain-containing protein [Kiritimatiellae bacterium]|nr:PA14 domain-containing protein [Kiritimatiellia bacterium]